MKESSFHRKDEVQDETDVNSVTHVFKQVLGIGNEWNNLIINASPDFIYSYDTLGRFTSVNTSLCKSLNMDADQIIGKTHREVGFPEVKCKEWDELHAEVYKKNKQVIARTSAVMPDNKKYFYEVILKPLHDSNDNIIGIGGITRDITGYTETKGELRDSRAEFYSLVDNAPDIIGIHCEGNVVFLNKKGMELLKAKSKDDVIGKPIMQFVHPDYFDIVIQRAKQAEFNHSSGDSLEEKFVCLDGSFIDVEVKSIPIRYRKKDSVLIIARDISEQRKAQELLKKEQLLLRTVIDNIPDSIYAKDLQGRKILANAQELKYMGVATEEEAIGKTDMDIYPTNDASKYITNDETVIKKGEPVINIIEVINQTNQKPHWLLTSKVPLRNEKNEIVGLVGIGRDISERQELLEKLHDNQERLNKIILSSADCVWEMNSLGKLVFCSDNVEKIFGITVNEVIGKSLLDFLEGDEKIRVEKHFTETLQKATIIVDFEYTVKRRDGKQLYILTNAYPNFDIDGKLKGYIGIDRDITEIKRAEQNAKRAIVTAQENEKKFIGTELHDNIAQLLVGSLMSLSIVKGKSDNDTLMLKQTISELQNIVAEIRALSHQLVPVTFKEHSFLNHVEELLKSINKNKRYRIQTYFEGLDESKLNNDLQLNLFRIIQEQLQNIIKHAEASSIEISIYLSDGLVSLRILDNGKGFDTNSSSEGIGLRNIKNRAEMFSGYCSIQSSEGKGFELLVKIPV